MRGACRRHAGAVTLREAPGRITAVEPSLSTAGALANSRHGISGQREEPPATKHVTPCSGTIGRPRPRGTAMARGAVGCAARKVEISDWSIRFSVRVTATRPTALRARPGSAALEI